VSGVPAAARVDDPIGHGYTSGKLSRLGFDIGLIVEVVLLVGTGGGKKLIQGGVKALGRSVRAWAGAFGEFIGGIADALDTAVTGHWLGEMLGDFIDTKLLGGAKQQTGKILEGAQRTFVEGKASARMTDPVQCDGGNSAPMEIALALTGLPSAAINIVSNILAMATGQKGAWESGIAGHGGSQVADGSFTVRIEGKLAARIDDGTTCDATIMKGAEKTFFGGPRASMAGSENRTEAGLGVQTALWAFGMISSAMSFLGSGLKSWKKPDKGKFEQYGRNVEIVSTGNKGFWLLIDDQVQTSPTLKAIKTLTGVGDRAAKIRAKKATVNDKGVTPSYKDIILTDPGTGPSATGAKTTKQISDQIEAMNKEGERFIVDPDDPDDLGPL
jgi:uncharacterized Zn-binding protein involved in type VI secretion